MMDGLKANHAVIVLADGTGSDPVGAKALEAALGESDGAQGLVFSGKVTDRIHELASGAGINTVVGKTVGAQSLKLGVQAYSVKDLE
jgi:hypothetical protein